MSFISACLPVWLSDVRAQRLKGVANAKHFVIDIFPLHLLKLFCRDARMAFAKHCKDLSGIAPGPVRRYCFLRVRESAIYAI